LKFENSAIEAFLAEAKEQFEEERLGGPVVADAWKQIAAVIEEPDSGIASGDDLLDGSSASPGTALAGAAGEEFAFGKRRGRPKVEHSRIIATRNAHRGDDSCTAEDGEAGRATRSGTRSPASKRGKKK
jgi:hypothetical protein